jgi:glycosyltransferase involved in cell wall biosynthesis
MTFLFLYTEIADYFLACCNQLSVNGEVHIVRWPVNKEAPFQFQENKTLKIYSKADYSYTQLYELVTSINPDVIICSGWIDKDYLKITKTYFRKIPTIMSCDTHWRGDLKQRLAMIISRFTLLKTFSHAWVPGKVQKQYVLNLGFKEKNIETGFYSCDLMRFEEIYQNQKIQKQTHFPKRFLYVGRYYDFKGIKELWQAFIELQSEEPNEWELWCLGIGDIEAVEHPKIKHFGFVQPKDLSAIALQCGVFVLPSRFEPWGVVVHEFAASGFPLLLSSEVGAKEQFLQQGKNGFEFEVQSVSGIKLALKKIINTSDGNLVEMSRQSNSIAKAITPQIWVDSLMKMTKAF